MRNSKSQYRHGGDLSFEYKLCLEAGLSYEVAQRIDFAGCGLGSVIYHLIALHFKSANDVDNYVKALGCLKDGSEATMNALADILDGTTLVMETITGVESGLSPDTKKVQFAGGFILVPTDTFIRTGSQLGITYEREYSSPILAITLENESGNLDTIRLP